MIVSDVYESYHNNLFGSNKFIYTAIDGRNYCGLRVVVEKNYKIVEGGIEIDEKWLGGIIGNLMSMEDSYYYVFILDHSHHCYFGVNLDLYFLKGKNKISYKEWVVKRILE